MVKKLLKRKLKLVSLNKLKTHKRRKTVLGAWARKQLILLCAKKLFIFYPKNCVTNQFLRKKHVTNLVFNNFSHTKSILGKSNHLNKVVLPSQPNLRLGLANLETRNLGITSSLTSLGNKIKSGVGGIRANLLQKQDKHVWQPYGVDLKTRTMQNRFLNWKSFYSLDQLMANQHEKTFRRKKSTYKTRLMERQKLTSLYGKVSKKNKLMNTYFSGTIPRKANLLPLLLEKRLDVALKRCFMFNTLRCARHWISQGRIRVNGERVRAPGLWLNPGDVFSIAKEHRESYISNFLASCYKMPKEAKYVQSGSLLSRWREWALLHSRSLKHYGVGNKQFRVNGAKADLTQPMTPGNKVNHRLNLTGLTHKKPRLGTQESTSQIGWPDRGIKNFWYLSGRYPFTMGYKVMRNTLGLISWLGEQRWGRINPRFSYWKLTYRRRIVVFSRWLLSQVYLTCDGLYFLRWHRAFIRKKSPSVLQNHRKLALGKPLHFEVSYKSLCAVYLYPPQRILWPCPMDFRKV